MNLAENDDQVLELDAEVDEDHCTICLQAIVDRALIPECSHEFCFECLMIWSEQSRRCPLCAQNIGEYLIHHIRSTYDYQKHYLPPLRTSPRPLPRIDGARMAPPAVTHRRRERVWGLRDRSAQDEADALERAVSWRRWIYRHNLYAKHVASNKYTRYRPYPTPSQFAASQDLIRRMTVFLRRELLVWPNADVEFLVTFVISLMKSIDIRSESAVKLLAEFLDMDTQYVAGERHVNAEHFAHEIYCYLRSPYRDLGVYDSVVQYDDAPPGIPPPASHERTRRWEPGLGSQSSRSRPLYHRSLHLHSHPPLIRGQNRRPERSSPALSGSGEPGSSRPDDSHSPTEEDSHVDDSSVSGPSRSHTRVKGKRKRRASTRSLSPPESDVSYRREQTGSPEVLATPNLSHFENTPRNTAVSCCTPTGDAGEALPRPPEDDDSGGTPVVSPRLAGGGKPNIAFARRTSDDRLSSLNGSRSLNDEIIASSSTSKSETPKRTINTNRVRANPGKMRQPRYRSQRDTIIAHLRGSVTTTAAGCDSSNTQAQSLLARMMADQTVAELDHVSRDDDEDDGADVAKRTAGSPCGESHVHFASRPKREEPEERQVKMKQLIPGPMRPSRPPCGGGSITSSHVHLLDRLYEDGDDGDDEDDEKKKKKATTIATATEARLRTQVRLRARLAAERRLAAAASVSAASAAATHDDDV